MEILGLTIIKNDEILITFDEGKMFLENIILDFSDHLIRLSFLISQKELFTTERLFYLEARPLDQKGTLKEVRSCIDINNSLLSIDFRSKFIDLDCKRMDIHDIFQKEKRTNE